MKKFFCFLTLGLALVWPFFALTNSDAAVGGGSRSAGPGTGVIDETAIILNDTTSKNTTTVKHGFAMKLDGSLNHFYSGYGIWGTVDDLMDGSGGPYVAHARGDIWVHAGPDGFGGAGTWSSLAWGGNTNHVLRGYHVDGIGAGDYIGWGTLHEGHLLFSDKSDLNATTSKHGLLPKLDGDADHVLNGVGAWVTPPGSGGTGNLNTSGTAYGGELAVYVDDTHVVPIGVSIGTGTNITTSGKVTVGSLVVAGGQEIKGISHVSFDWDPAILAAYTPITIGVNVPGFHVGDAVILGIPPLTAASGVPEYCTFKTMAQGTDYVTVILQYSAGSGAVNLDNATYTLTVIHY